MQDNKDKRPCKKLKVNFTYKKPTDDELRNLIDRLIEEVDTKEELEDQLCRFVHAMRKKDGSEYHVSSVNSCMFAINRHLNNKSVLSKPINIMDKDQYYKLWQILNGKVKSLVSQGRGERNGADGFTEDDLLQIFDHPAMSGNDPASLLYRIFFFNAIFLGLRGGEHFNLQLQNFIRRKDKYGGFDVIIYKSKTNQRGANNIESQGDKLYIPEIPSIIETYENYFTKRPTQADPHFYLKPCNISEVEFNGQWYHKQHVSEKEIKSFMKKIVTLTGINVNDRKISNHSGLARYERPETEIQRNNAFNLVEAFGFNKNNIRSEESMEQSTLSTDNFVVAKSLLNDNREVINSANSNIKVTRRPLKDLNEIQENKSQNLEELVSKLTADKLKYSLL
ncbi:zinc finger MYM-type protein 2-like [Rhizophagus clarus]|uniref:Zinc finger MYM-type protein 2-like n=1 Tax=Rhizophagus clarus TaxID=94130 RepID=A0A8H3LFF6_9GLOM|nr:zinc finger MYM-type protein 2-like [Rhizophagus clarus]